MTKAHHIAFLAFAAGDRLQLRIPAREQGTLLWYCTEHGLHYQYI